MYLIQVLRLKLSDNENFRTLHILCDHILILFLLRHSHMFIEKLINSSDAFLLSSKSSILWFLITGFFIYIIPKSLFKGLNLLNKICCKGCIHMYDEYQIQPNTCAHMVCFHKAMIHRISVENILMGGCI